MFVNLKNSRMFAVPKPILIFSVVVFFYATNIPLYAKIQGYQIPVDYRTEKSVIGFGESGGDSLSYIHSVTNKIHSHMPKPNEFVSPTKVSSGANTPYIATNVPTSFSANNNTASAIVQGENNHITINCEFKSVFSKENLRQMLTEILKEFTEKGLITIHSNNQ